MYHVFFYHALPRMYNPYHTEYLLIPHTLVSATNFHKQHPLYFYPFKAIPAVFVIAVVM